MEQLKNVEKMLEQELKQYGSEHANGKQMTSKDPEKIAHLAMAYAFTKLLCLLEEPDKMVKKAIPALVEVLPMLKGLGGMEGSGGQKSGGLLGGLMGGGSPFGGFGSGNNGGGMSMRHPIGFDRDEEDDDDTYMRRGGNTRYMRGYDRPYGTYGDDIEDRRRRSSRTGRFVRSEGDEGPYMGGDVMPENKQGTPNSGSTSTPGTVGPTRR